MVLIITKISDKQGEKYQYENSEIKSEVWGYMKIHKERTPYDERKNSYSDIGNGIPLE
jgi:pyrroloquinoline quinone (PQQ) biosynthesis protein C